jgi:hypothetical protein
MPTNKFHYIWMGSVQQKYESAFKDGPNDLARQLRELIHHSNPEEALSPKGNPQDQEIIMWVPEDIISNIRECNLLDPLITLKPIEDIYKNAKHLSPDELDNLRRSVDVLGNHKAYSAQKDVLSAAILEEYGGYYFDTTTQIQSISTLIDKQSQEIWFPAIMVHSVHEDGSDYIYHGELFYATTYLKGDNEFKICGEAYLPDVWAMHYSNPGQGIFRRMLNNYTKKCQYYFPESFNNQHLSESSYMMTFEGHTFNKSGYSIGDEGTGSKIMKSENRDRLIGELVIYSLLDAVSESYGSPSEEVMERISLPAIHIDNYKFVESMGIKKFHNGIWRKEVLATQMDNISAPLITPQVSQNQVQTSKEQSRNHMLPVTASEFKNIKLKYQKMKGDALKGEIIADFRKQIAEIHSLEALNLFVADFKKSVSYNVLKTGQSVITRLGIRGTDSEKMIDSIVKQKMFELEQAQFSHGLQK